MNIKLVNHKSVQNLRHLVLRPHQNYSSTYFEGDERPTTFHFLMRSRNEDIAIISYFKQTSPYTFDPQVFQIRGMAIHPKFQNRGFGGEILTYSLSFLLSNFALKILWCNARKAAIPFYQKYGFEVKGHEFEIPLIGTHVGMEKMMTFN